MATVTDYEYVDAEQSETFDSIAYDLYGDEFLASEIIAANPQHAGVLFFEGGEELKVPVYDEDTDSDATPPWRRS